MTPALARAMFRAKVAPPPVAVVRLPPPPPLVEPEPTPCPPDPLAAVVAPTPRPDPTLRRLLQEVAAAHCLMPSVLRQRGRRSEQVLARNEFFYRAMAETQHSSCAIGRFVDRDHTTVRHGVGRHCMVHGLEPPRGFDLADEAERRMSRNRDLHRKRKEGK